MPPPENDDESTRQQRYVRAAADVMNINLDPAWVPAIARNIELLLNAAQATRIAGADQFDVGQRFEP